MAGNNAGPFVTLAARLKVKCYDLEELVYDRMGLTSINPGDLAPFPNLQCLYVPYNRLTALENLEQNFRLTIIDARQNKISKIHLENQKYLQELLLSGNKLVDLDDFIGAVCGISDLSVLDLRGNPLTLEKGYRQRIIRCFQRLTFLDGIEVTPEERNPPSVPKRRPMSMLQYLKTRPLSRAESDVIKEADTIRQKREEQHVREVTLATAAARRRKEEYDLQAKTGTIPLPESLVQNTSKKREILEERKPKESNTKTRTRMFITMPKIHQPVLTKEEERMLARNPKLTGLLVPRCKLEPIYPQSI